MTTQNILTFSISTQVVPLKLPKIGYTIQQRLFVHNVTIASMPTQLEAANSNLPHWKTDIVRPSKDELLHKEAMVTFTHRALRDT